LLKNLDDRYCPHCGLSVWLSLNPNDSLEWSNANWLRKAAQGAWLLALVQPIALAAFLLATGASLVERISSFQNEYEELERAAATHPATMPAHLYVPQFSWGISIALILAGVYFVLNAAGLLRLTSHEQRYPDRNRTIRTWSQVISAIAAALGCGLAVLGGLLIVQHAPLSPPIGWLLMMTSEVVFAASASCAWFCLRRVARRGRKSGLARLCGYLLFLPVFPFLKAAPFIGLYFLWLLVPFAEFLPVIYIPVSIYLFIRFALLMQAAAPEAEKSWASETKA
jgi:hypothetical protein